MNDDPKLVFVPLRTDLELLPTSLGPSGEARWILFDPVEENYFRLDRMTYEIILLFQEKLTAEEILKKLNNIDIEVTEIELLQVSQLLRSNNLCRIEVPYKSRSVPLAVKAISSLIFLRLPLFTPKSFLLKTRCYANFIFNRWVVSLLLLLSFSAYLRLPLHYSRLEQDFINSLSWSGAGYYFITMFFIKILHEFAHAYTATSFSVPVRKMGLAFIVFIPRFYSDITDSWRLPNRWHRFLIDSAGIFCEIIIGAIAIFIWVGSPENSAMSRLCFSIFTYSLINTVLINGNPLMRFDGYYSLMDCVNVDNLYQRGRLQFNGFLRHFFFGLKQMKPQLPPGYERFLLTYGCMTFFYRIFIYTSIVTMIFMAVHPWLGLVLATAEISVILIWPLSRELKFLSYSKGQMKTGRLLMSSIAFSIVLAILFLPWNWPGSLPMEVKIKQWPVYIKESGFAPGIRSNDFVYSKGMEIVKLNNPFLENELQQLIKQKEEVELEQKRYFTKGYMSAYQMRMNEAKALKHRIEEIREKLSGLSLTSPISGHLTFVPNFQGQQWLGKGLKIANIYDTSNIQPLAYCMERDKEHLQVGAEVEIQIDTNSYKGRISSVGELPFKELNYSPLLKKAGGSIETFNGNDTPVNDLFIMEITTDTAVLEPGRIGSVVYMRRISLFDLIKSSFIQLLRKNQLI